MTSINSFNSQKKIAVLYLARKAEGIEPVLKFLNSYLKMEAGIEHDLVILYKGFNSNAELDNYKQQLPNLKHLSIEMPDEGYDLGSYTSAATKISHEFICCLNTFSQILSPNWLQKLYKAFSNPKTGLVGATGSYESVHNLVKLLQNAIWLYNFPSRELRNSVEKYFHFTLPKNIIPITYPNRIKCQYKLCEANIKLHIRSILYLLKKEISNNSIEDEFGLWWKKKKYPQDIAEFCNFPTFPNPHIRTTAFMIRREKFLVLKRKLFLNKFDACYFESGQESMTRQIMKENLSTLIVGKDGNSYDIREWPTSNIFRSGNQSNLLIGDNHTAVFDNSPPQVKISFLLSTWGEEAVTIPEDFPPISVRFQKHLLDKILPSN